MRRAIWAFLVLLLGMSSARADMYTFTYSDGSIASNGYGDIGFGTLTTKSSGLGDGSVLASSGSLTLTSSANSNAYAGTYSLVTFGSYPQDVSGIGFIDNLVYPGDNAFGPSPAPPSYLTSDGLLFGETVGSTTTYVNLFYYSDAGNPYGIIIAANGNTVFGPVSNGQFKLISPVPEPTGIVLLSLGIVCLTIGYIVRRKTLAIV